ncbi:unnamed protein product [Vitrella brassicaformis CCMP3155]|uniref:J domain-containing protein n=1 Tax=Vitrella brassicaformis (strain CCMP3155) TaxID=1169540 RepID=A0A0G4FZA6_VITBC|nr:unnamed protein product [Vitrella brassicaformis CCMP3155]|eukprot:CEM20424.1 unnamed protein product [Vitrella brassicaformis CCMP3155]
MAFPASHLRLLLGILLGVCAFLALAGEEKETYYDVLGVEQKATDDEIKKAYRKMAVQYHPDKYQGDKKEAEERFIRIAEAYETLSNPDKRKQYDASLAGGAGGFDFGAAHHFSFAQADEMFKDFFKGFEDMFKGFDADPFAAFGGGGGGGSASFSTSFSSSSSSSFSSFSSSSGGSFSSQKGYSKSVAHRNVNGKQETIVTEKWTEPNGTVKTKTTRKTSDGQEYITEEAHNKEHQAVAGSDKTAVAEDRGQQPHVDPFAGVFGSIFEEL